MKYSFKICGEQGGEIEIGVERYEQQEASHEYDANWLVCSVRVQTGTFSGSMPISILTFELVNFRDTLEHLIERESGSAQLNTLEEQLLIEIQSSQSGSASVTGVVTSADRRTSIKFEFTTPLGVLATTHAELISILEAFPPRSPD